jgi:hypothetical protein
MNLLSLINLSLAYIYCSTTLSNHGLIRLNKLVLVCAFSFVNNLYLILHVYVQTSAGTATSLGGATKHRLDHP